MVKRIFKNMLLAAFIILISSFILFGGILYHHLETELYSQMRQQAGYLTTGLIMTGISYLEELEQIETRITWIAEDGMVLFDNQVSIETMENHRNREEVAAAVKKGTGISSRYSSTLGRKIIYYALRLEDGTVIRMAYTQDTVWSLLAGMVPSLLLIILIAVFLSAVLALRVAQKIVRPINQIDLSATAEQKSYEELSPLLTRINQQNKEIAAQMREAQRKQYEFSMITENMQEGFIVTDSRMEILSYNSSVQRVFQIDEELSGHNIFILNRSEPFRSMVELAAAGESSDRILPLDNRYYQMIANPVYYDQVVSGMVVIILDITERELREGLRREFTSNVSHELKTPLTGIYGTAEILMNGMVREEDIALFARNIHDEAGRLMTLISDIINLSQLDENVVPKLAEQIDLYELCQEVMERLEFTAAQKQVTMVLTGKHVMVSGSRPILEEMIYNLCDNSIKYNKDHGKVEISLMEHQGNISLLVADTGIGIPIAHQERVFERFYRVDKSHSKEIGGTGLGLSIVKHGAIYHGASIRLKSQEHVGTKIEICWDTEKNDRK